MATNIVHRINPMPLPVIVTDPAAPDSGDPVRFGSLTGIALLDEGDGGVPAATYTMVDFGWYVATHPVTDVVAGISVGDTVYYDDGADRLENDTTGTPYGIALEAVGAAATTSIKVLHVPAPAIGAGLVNTAALADGVLSADASGRAKMADDYFNAAQVLAKFDADSFDNAQLLLAVKNGAFVADAATRALFADGFVNGAKLAASILHVDLVNGGAAGDHTVTGIASGDEIVFVGHFSTAAAIATLADLTSEFSVTGADTINNAAGTDTSSDQLMVIWLDKT